MNPGKTFCLIVTFCFLNTTGRPAEGASVLSLDQVIRKALANNRNLRIAALEIERTKSRHRWSGRLSNPQLQVAGSSDFAGLDEDEAVFEIAFSQQFPLTSRLRDERAVRRVQVILAETELAENRRLLGYETHKLAVEFLAAKTTKAAQNRLIQLNKEIVDFLQKQVGVGEASRLDVTQTQLNGRALIRAASRLDVKMKKQMLSLKRQLNLPPDHKIELTGNLAVPASPPGTKYDTASVLCRRPDYLALLVKADVARAEAVLQHSMRWEDIGLKLFAEREHAVDDPTGLEKNTFLGIGVSIPLPFRNKNEQGIQVANINKGVSLRQISAREFEIENELASAFQERASSWKLAHDSTGRDLKLAHDNFDEFRTAYENAQVSVIQVQRAQEQLLELATVAVELQREFHLADAQLRFVRAAYANLGIPSEEGTKAQRGGKRK